MTKSAAYQVFKTFNSDFHLSNPFCLLQWKHFKNDENVLYFIVKALFVLTIFKFLSWLFGHVEKTVWLER